MGGTHLDQDSNGLELKWLWTQMALDSNGLDSFLRDLNGPGLEWRDSIGRDSIRRDSFGMTPMTTF